MAEEATKEKLHKCEICGKMKKESEGVYMLEGTSFCCKDCAEKNKGKKDKEGEVCEFC
ncbi:MAG: hypothetical protein R3251_04200 [Candidatus Spechtbacterales bacterium]|nr:hypothetical protein [Candidatus Spechtbacterales bacterium]